MLHLLGRVLESAWKHGLGIRGPHVEVPGRKLFRHPVHATDVAVGVASGDLLQCRADLCCVGELRVDLARDEGPLAVRRERFL